MSRRLNVDAYFDFICPWCLIGKRQLDGAIEILRGNHPDVEIEVKWQGVQLLQELPVQGVPFAEFYLRRLGSAEAVRMRQGQVQQAAAAAGVAIDLARIERMPNTAAAHRLFSIANVVGSAAQRDALLERLFSAYFHHGEDLGDHATLLRIAVECGFASEDIEPALKLGAARFTPVLAQAPITSVPSFVFNQDCQLSGAQPIDVLVAAMGRSLSPACAGE